LPQEDGIYAPSIVTDDGSIPFPVFGDESCVGKPVQKTLGITKYEKPAPKNSDARGNFPLHIVPITDEERIQNMPHILKDLGDVDITLKHDGTSLTYIRCGKFDGEINTEILCSRKLALKPNDSCYWLVHEKYNLKDLPDDIVVQGELCGPKIQGNKQGLKEYRLYVFNVYSQVYGWYSNEQVREFCEVYGLDTVRHVYTGPMKWDLKGLLDLADEQKYENGSQAEGIVIRSLETRDKVKPISFKVISNKFMLKNGE
jgi:RNA ligase (TIGR02306 family)